MNLDPIFEQLAYTQDKEVIYVNEKRHKRMMARRIKRAREEARQMKQFNEIRLQQHQDTHDNVKYRYPSRHNHATKRIRDGNGRFKKSQNDIQSSDSQETNFNEKNDY